MIALPVNLLRAKNVLRNFVHWRKKLGRWNRNMKVDLKDTDSGNDKFSRFEDESINFDKSVNFVFGKNGTGKSSICDLIRSQNSNGEHDMMLIFFKGLNLLLVMIKN